MERPSYYSVITANVRYDNNLTDSEKLLFAEITSLSNKYGYCTASNNYFAKLYNVSKVTISRRISSLRNNGYLNVELIKENNEIKQRKLHPLTNTYIPINNSVNTPHNNSVNSPINKNVKENSTSINTTSNNITSINSNSGQATTQTRPPYKEIIDYLNEQTGKNFSHTAKGNKKLISGRFNDGNSVEVFKHVIDVKVADWLDDVAMKTYLKPETLFNSSNFDKYKNETIEEVQARKQHWQKAKNNNQQLQGQDLLDAMQTDEYWGF